MMRTTDALRTPASEHDIHLDMLRGLSAFLVLANHLRAFVFVEYDRLAGPPIASKLFYFATGFGHQAVVVFFVLSGYFVGGNVCRRIAQNRWDWRDYASDRLSRLWTVLLPALGLTYLWDSLGLMSGSQYYSGALQPVYHSGPNTPVDLGFSCFLANMFFLQTVAANTYGTNGPLWSLAYEFFYYIIFPLMALILLPRRGLLERSICAAASLALAAFLPVGIWYCMPIWLMGVAVWWLRTKFLWKANGYLWTVPAISVLALQLASKFGVSLGFFSDWALGGLVAIMILALPRQMARGAQCYGKIATAASNISYTLYLTHFPLLGFLCAVLLRGERFGFAATGILVYFALMLAALGYCYCVYCLFERHTPKIRQRLKALLPPGQTSPRRHPNAP